MSPRATLMKSEGYVIGIDGGGTKTLGLIADTHGKGLASPAGGTANPQVIGFEKASQVVLKVIKECCRRAKCHPGHVLAVVVGLAGAGRESDRQRAEIGIRRLARKKKIPLRSFRVESDARM